MEPTVSKVVENQNEKVRAAPESILLYYTKRFIRRAAKNTRLFNLTLSCTESLHFQPHLQRRNLFTA